MSSGRLKPGHKKGAPDMDAPKLESLLLELSKQVVDQKDTRRGSGASHAPSRPGRFLITSDEHESTFERENRIWRARVASKLSLRRDEGPVD